ncbi:hypothetical protein [Massilia sp. DD77]|uniref:hypothetical protein n=1 Tax=Massilia sp. DD77 TaxID=3109349 RepID=UPI003000047D
MKWSKFSTIFVVWLVLAQHGQCAKAESAKAPLTVADMAQCRAQVTEFNQHVQAHNAKVDELKALEAEINALSAALDKEQAAVDRYDSDAMQALNAKILKNNELVARYEQMVSSTKASASENEERAAQFRESCENRPLAPRLAPQTQPQPSDSLCGSPIGAKEVERQIQAALAQIRADEKQHQAKVDQVAQAQAKAHAWNNEKRSKVWLQVLVAPKFMTFEREKQPYVQELMRILGTKPKSSQEACRLTQRMAAMLPAIKAINARQYAFMADEIRKAK